MEDDLSQKKSFFPLPYGTAIEAEELVRNQSDFWTFRVLANVLRQTPEGINRYKNRYNSPINWGKNSVKQSNS